MIVYERLRLYDCYYYAFYSMCMYNYVTLSNPALLLQGPNNDYYYYYYYYEIACKTKWLHVQANK